MRHFLHLENSYSYLKISSQKSPLVSNFRTSHSDCLVLLPHSFSILLICLFHRFNYLYPFSSTRFDSLLSWLFYFSEFEFLLCEMSLLSPGLLIKYVLYYLNMVSYLDFHFSSSLYCVVMLTQWPIVLKTFSAVCFIHIDHLSYI